MKKKILLVINPVAGTMKAKNAFFRIVNAFCENEDTVTTVVLQYRGQATEICQAQAGNYDRIVCCGGDGTLNEVISGVVRSGIRVPIGYIPAGSTNDFAVSMGVPISIGKAIDRAVHGEPVEVDLGSFNNSYFSYIASFGAFTKASYSATQNAKNALGHSAYVFEAMRDLQGNLQPANMTVRADGRIYNGEYIFGAVANTKSVAGIIKFNPSMYDASDGLFEVILVRNPKNVNDFSQIVNAVNTSKFEGVTNIDFFKASEISFVSDTPTDWSLDGECVHGGNTANVINLKKRMILIM